MSDSVRPHRWQPTRLLCPWDSSGKNPGVGCHFLLQYMHACYVTSVMSDSVRPHGQQPTRLLCPEDSLGKNPGTGCHFLPIYIFMQSGLSSKSSILYFIVLTDHPHILQKHSCLYSYLGFPGGSEGKASA